MKAHGHQGVAEAAGLPLLEAAFSQGGPKPRLGAFYLGNWIADFSQVIDPVGVAGLRDLIKQVVHDVFDRLLDGIYLARGAVLEPLSGALDYDSLARTQRTRLVASLQSFFDALIVPTSGPGSHSLLFEALQPAVLLKGYFKFVHPLTRGDPPRMDLVSYVTIFEELFVQYYPHEHLDRPKHPAPDPVTSPTAAPQYDDRKAQGSRNTHTAVSESPDLYWYLRDDLEILAGRLADVDLNWASPFLTQSAPSDEDIAWNRGLARLGQALHGVEDFFAHSNFVEHAARVMAEREPLIWTKVVGNNRFYQRLKRYDYLNIPDDWTKNADEDYVVTGYFDFVDTLFSLWHLLEAGIAGFGEVVDIQPVDAERHVRDMGGTILDPEGTDEKIASAADRALRDLLEIANDPRKLSGANKDNAVVKAIQKAVDDSFLGDLNDFIDALKAEATTPDTMAVLIANMPLFQDISTVGGPAVSPETAAARGKILSAFVNYVRLMLLPVEGAQAGVSLYTTCKTLIEIGRSPPLWFEKEVVKWTRNYLLGVLLFQAKVPIGELFGKNRIGCHSLLSKDHGGEVLYDEMERCATAVHYYVVKTMLRWQQPGAQWVNWLELLEFFTRHPSAGVMCAVPKTASVEIVHTLTPAEASRSLDQLLKDLVLQYQPVTLMPVGVPFTEEVIRHANCSTRIKGTKVVEVAESVVAALVAPVLSVPLRLRRIVVPHIRHLIIVCDPNAVPQQWYMPVMKDGWKAIQTQNPHVLRFHPDRDGAVQQMNRGNNLRAQWETFYRP